MRVYSQEKVFVIRRLTGSGFKYYRTNANTGTIEWGGPADARRMTPRQAALTENICIEEGWVVEVIPHRENLTDV